VTPADADARFNELLNECRALCPSCAAENVPIETDAPVGGRWFHLGRVVEGISATTQCAAGKQRDEMNALRTRTGWGTPPVKADGVG
jgi:hypothetical protein